MGAFDAVIPYDKAVYIGECRDGRRDNAGLPDFVRDQTVRLSKADLLSPLRQKPTQEVCLFSTEFKDNRSSGACANHDGG